MMTRACTACATEVAASSLTLRSMRGCAAVEVLCVNCDEGVPCGECQGSGIMREFAQRFECDACCGRGTEAD
jgi:hypothetical protein